MVVDASGPLKGLKIIEAALLYPGPYCSSLLLGLGAEVIKIERPGLGDRSRRRPAFFDSLNQGKKSLTLDLKTPAGREILYRLVQGSDVFTEGFRPGVAAKLGVDHQTLAAINPGLVYCSISGFGQDGPYRDRPGHDINYLSLSGMLHYLRDQREEPILPGVAMADLSAGTFAALGIMTALYVRQRTGQGQQVDISMMDGLLSWMGTNLATYAATGNSQRMRDAGYGLFTTQDGRQLALGIAFEDWFWERLCAALGLEGLAGLTNPQRVERRQELSILLQEVLARHPLDHWVSLLEKADVPATAVQTPEEVMNDPQAKARGMFRLVNTDGDPWLSIGAPLKLSGHDAPGPLARAPRLGENSRDILRGIGYQESDINRLRDEGVI